VIRGTINGLLRRAGVEVRRKPPCLIRSAYEATLTLEHACAHLAAFNPERQFNVIQVGAFDGRTNDPIHAALRRFGWRSVLVEPQSGPFSELRTLHDGQDSVQVFNVAIAEADGTRSMYALQGNGLPFWAPQATSFNRELLVTQLAALRTTAAIREFEVETWTFATLLSRAGMDRVDVLQLDAEGYDYELLKLFDVPSRLPAVIGYEHQHLTKADRIAVAELLVGCGYQLAMSHWAGDTVALRHK
jgi:FkbM family methyltransferase